MAEPAFTLIENGEVFAPERQGRATLLLAYDKIVKAAPQIDRRALDRLGVEYQVVDAGNRFIVPGFIDPHEHLHGASLHDDA